MNESFFDRPILNSPYAYPGRHWELDADGQPTNRIIETRRRSDLIAPVPKPKKRRQPRGQAEFVFDAGDGLSTEEQEYNPTPIINEVRTYVEAFGCESLGWKPSSARSGFRWSTTCRRRRSFCAAQVTSRARSFRGR